MAYPAPLGSNQGGYNPYPPAQYPNPQYGAYGPPMQSPYGQQPPPPPGPMYGGPVPQPYGGYGSPYGAPYGAPQPPPPPQQPQVIIVQQPAPPPPRPQTIVVNSNNPNDRYCRRCRTYHRHGYCRYENDGCGAQ